VTRVPAIQLEKLVVEAVRAEARPDMEPGDLSDRTVIDRYVARIIVRPDSIDVELRGPTVVPAPLLDGPENAGAAASSSCATVISLPWSAPAFLSVKGVLHQPEAKPTLKQETRDAILLAIAKARSWIDDLVSDRVLSFDEIAEREGRVERHIRLLTPLAFIPPRTLAAIIDGTGPHDATVTALAQAVPYRWDRNPAGQVWEQTPDDGH
jgi:site-specific DNA recombinase